MEVVRSEVCRQVEVGMLHRKFINVPKTGSSVAEVMRHVWSVDVATTQFRPQRSLVKYGDRYGGVLYIYTDIPDRRKEEMWQKIRRLQVPQHNQQA